MVAVRSSIDKIFFRIEDIEFTVGNINLHRSIGGNPNGTAKGSGNTMGACVERCDNKQATARIEGGIRAQRIGKKLIFDVDSFADGMDA